METTNKDINFLLNSGAGLQEMKKYANFVQIKNPTRQSWVKSLILMLLRLGSNQRPSD